MVDEKASAHQRISAIGQEIRKGVSNHVAATRYHCKKPFISQHDRTPPITGTFIICRNEDGALCLKIFAVILVADNDFSSKLIVFRCLLLDKKLRALWKQN